VILLNIDLKTFTSCFNNLIKFSVKLNDNQFGALSSCTFTEGCANMESSQLIKRLNNGGNPNKIAKEEGRLAGG
jgi:GH24 family phage-related lysozyme (muramidase)